MDMGCAQALTDVRLLPQQQEREGSRERTGMQHSRVLEKVSRPAATTGGMQVGVWAAHNECKR